MFQERRAQCLIKLGRKDEAKEEFAKANKLLESSSLRLTKHS